MKLDLKDCEVCISSGLRTFRSLRQKSAMGSQADQRLLARNWLKLPGGYHDRASAPLRTGNGWLADL